MASGGPLRELCEEASCSVCLDLFSDPVTVAECGHNFCRACLSRSWGEAAARPSCPQCRGPAQQGSLRPNQQLANMVKILKKCSPAEEREKGVERGGGGVGACEKHGEPLRWFCREDAAPLCVVCHRSREHRGHQVTPLEEAALQKETVVAARKERVCQKHLEWLKLFCKYDEAPICVVCEQSEEHKDHDIIPVEEASQEYKAQFCACVETLQKEKNKLLEYKACVVKESQDLIKQAKGERQKTVTKFRQLHTLLDQQEELLLAEMEDVEKEIVRRKDWYLAKLSKELSSLESLIQEMEEKCQQAANDLLQDASSILQRYDKKEEFENLVVFPLALKWRIWDISDFSPLLEGIKKHFRDTLDSTVHLQKANVTLDPDTASPKLILSKSQKSVRIGEKAQELPNNPERFDQYGAVLGYEGFTGGRHFWEVLVGSEEQWMVGVARKSVERKKKIVFSSENGIWAVGRWSGEFRVSGQGTCLPPLAQKLRRIRVCLNYVGGEVAFFDADQAAPLYKFSGASFSGEILLPFFLVYLKGHIMISS